MTILEMHTYFDQLMDKSGSPWFTEIEKDSLIDAAQIEFLQTRGDVYELNERLREDLADMTIKYTAASTSVIDLSLIDNFCRVASVMGVFTNPICPGKTILSPVVPIQLDDLADTLRDPFAKPDNKNPGYIQYNDGTITSKLEIISTTIPVSVIMYYIKLPVSVNSQTSPPINCELPVYVHNEIVNIAVRKAMMIANDPNYQVQINEIRNQGK